MQMQKHPDAECPQCHRVSVWYALKAEATGWKVHCTCDPEVGCGHEWTAGWISRAQVGSLDDAAKRAESLCAR